MYTNLKSLHFVFLIKFKKKTNIKADIGEDLIPVNNSFAHWIKGISITKYGTNTELIPTATPQEVYQYSDSMLKHLPEKSLNVIQHDLLYSQKAEALPNNLDRRLHYDLTAVKSSKPSIAADVILDIKRQHFEIS